MTDIARIDAAPDEDPPTGIVYADPDEGRRIFDEAIRAHLGISGEEFIRRWDTGDYWIVADQSGSRHIGRLIMMIPLARQRPQSLRGHDVARTMISSSWRLFTRDRRGSHAWRAWQSESSKSRRPTISRR